MTLGKICLKLGIEGKPTERIRNAEARELFERSFKVRLAPELCGQAKN